MSEQNANDTISFDLPKNQSSVIKVIGVGGGGSNAINHMFGMGIRGVDFVVCNTDAQALTNSTVPNKIQLGVTLTEGLGAGANPEVGEQAALENIEEVRSLLETNTKMVFITAGMGGGTGTGAAPVIAKAAKDMGILTVGICTIPFQFEGATRKLQAEKGVESLRDNVDSLVVINNNKLREVYGNLGFKAGFAKADEVLATAARGIAEVITHHYTTNIDLRDAKTVLANSGTAIMGSSSASGEQRANEAIAKALDSPLLNDNHIRGAKNVLLLIVSGKVEITIDEIGEINDFIQQEAGGSANIIMGIGDDEGLEDDIAVTVIATGFAADQQVQVIGGEPQKVVHTLEDDQAVSNTVFQKPLAKDEDESDDMISAELAKLSKKPEKSNQKQPDLFDSQQNEETASPANDSKEEEPLDEHESKQANGEESIKHKSQNPTEEIPQSDKAASASKNRETTEDAKAEQSEESKAKESEADEPIFEIDTSIGENMDRGRKVFVLEDDEDSSQETRAEQEQEEKSSENSRSQKEENAREKQQKQETIRYTLDDYSQLENRLRTAKPDQSEKKPQKEVKTKNQDSTEDEDLQFEVRQVESKSSGGSEEGGTRSPMDSTIQESMQMQAEERKAKFKAFNYRFKNHPFSVDDTDNEPAYKRQGVKIEDTSYSKESRAGRFTIEDGEGGSDIKTNNSFLHDNVD